MCRAVAERFGERYRSGRSAVRIESEGRAPARTLIGGIIMQDDMKSTVSLFETTVSDRSLPFHGLERCQIVDKLLFHVLQSRSARR